MRSRLVPLYSLAAIFILLQSGCSSSSTTANDGLPIEGESMSGADTVGSIPEDMLAADEGVSSANTDSSAAASGEDLSGKSSQDATDLTASATPAADPFADLADKSSDEGSDSVATTGETSTYTVKAGDTLMKVAFTIYGDIDRWKELHDWNRDVLKSANSLRKGMKLKYETPVNSFSPEELGHSYVIKPGDTLANIADEVYGRKMKYRKLQKYNQRLVKNPNRIFAGFTLFYDITAQEMAEAEQRRQERAAAGGGGSMIPSAITPVSPDVAPAAPAPVANSPAPAPASAAQ